MNGNGAYLFVGGVALFLVGLCMGALLFGDFQNAQAPRLAGAPASVVSEEGKVAVPPEALPARPQIAAGERGGRTGAHVLGGDGRPPEPKPADPLIERSGVVALLCIVGVCGFVIVFAVVRHLLLTAKRAAGA